jgi:hypothetical protein
MTPRDLAALFLRNPFECTLIAAIVLAAWGWSPWVWEMLPCSR